MVFRSISAKSAFFVPLSPHQADEDSSTGSTMSSRQQRIKSSIFGKEEGSFHQRMQQKLNKTKKRHSPDSISTNSTSSCKSSCSSTSTISLKQPDGSSSTTRKTTKNSVRFDETKNQYITDKRRNIYKNLHKQWYTNEEYQEMREASRMVVRRFLAQMKKEQEQDDNVDGEESTGNNKTMDLSASVQIMDNILAKVKSINYVLEDSSLIKGVPLRNGIHHLYSKKAGGSFEYIGLELYMSSAYQADNTERKELIQDVVLDIQLEKEKGLWTNTEDELRQEFRDCCRQVSQTQALMAQLIARAQLTAR